ncbi:transposase family protein [Streptomyces niveus]|nr:transposase family protein [Streptomyces niveus]
MGGGIVLLDGSVIRTRRRTGKENRKNYSGKNKCHGLLVIALTDDRGRLLWISAARPGRTSEITACRHDQLTAKLRAAGLGAIADLGFVGLDDSDPGADPAVITGYKAARNRPLTRRQKLSNKVLAAVRAPVEHGFAHLKNWTSSARSAPTRSGRPPWSGPCWSSRTAKSPDDRRSSPKSPASDQHEHPDAHTPVTSNFNLHTAQWPKRPESGGVREVQPGGIGKIRQQPCPGMADHPRTVSGDSELGTRTDTLHAENAFRLDRQNPSTRFIVPAQKALS